VQVVDVRRNELALVPVKAIPLSVTAELLLFLMVMGCVADTAPTAVEGKVRLPGVRLMAGAAAPVAVPVSGIVCGELAALSATVKVATRLPAMVGLKVMPMMQEEPAASAVPQALLSENDAAFVPVKPMLAMESEAVPVLLRVTEVELEAPTAVLPKLMESAERLAAGAGAVPVPLTETVCGEVYALSVIPSEAVRAPVVVGLKVTVIVQVALTATLVPQVFACVNEVGFVPEKAMPLIMRVDDPVFLSVTAWVALAYPCTVAGKLRVDGESVTCGAFARGHLLTTFATFSEPRPVARSNPAPAE
jgi:hypothetical protein